VLYHVFIKLSNHPTSNQSPFSFEQSKLTSLLSKRKLPFTLLEKLSVIEGDARNVDKVKETVQSVDVVVSGVGTWASCRH
jgi:hypothetical protein